MHLKVEYRRAQFYDVIDLKTGHRIPLVQEADDKTGKLSMYLYDRDGSIITEGKNKEAVLFEFKGKIKLVKKEKTNAKR